MITFCFARRLLYNKDLFLIVILIAFCYFQCHIACINFLSYGKCHIICINFLSNGKCHITCINFSRDFQCHIACINFQIIVNPHHMY